MPDAIQNEPSIKGEWRYNWLVLAAIIVHGGWGLLLLFSDEPLKCTPMAENPLTQTQYVSACVYLAAAGFALYPMIVERHKRSWIGLWCCIPQQFLLMVSAFTACSCVIRGTYADGVPRPWEFILADQSWVIVGMTLHTASLIDWFYFSRG